VFSQQADHPAKQADCGNSKQHPGQALGQQPS